MRFENKKEWRANCCGYKEKIARPSHELPNARETEEKASRGYEEPGPYPPLCGPPSRVF